MQLKFYLDHHSRKYCLQNGSFFYDIGVLLLRDVRYKSVHPSRLNSMHFSLFSCIKMSTLSFFHLGLVCYSNYEISLLLIYVI